ncbi:uncharacterized protein NEPG_01812 [Nematocida parisii ERTm1]|uniref:uncharacterized protein n=1 Tax=Nematocida parisii (strain ERTm1 / ATCC PRA-289) TaxID=881290 RepID=UPI000264BB3A|nr:uncharacterized protein NEPG_01812 [Nematocida parisii ERTm1]EIJ93470.1 hypothetical protein NEPG_01812 [Nematocida parisii ERTm1]|eukprot:XP_013059640.1 hypothetical protein NEPG_01812 [Nematocida parisii ERTm1]
MKRSSIFILILILTAGIGVPAAFLFIRGAKKRSNNRKSENAVNSNTVLKAEEAVTEQEEAKQERVMDEQVKKEQERAKDEQEKKEQEKAEEVPYIVDDMGFVRFNSLLSSESSVHNNVEQEDEHVSAHHSSTEQEDEHVSAHHSNTEQEDEHVSAHHSNTEQDVDGTSNKTTYDVEYVSSIFTKPSEEPVNEQSPAVTEDNLDNPPLVNKKGIKPESVNTQVENENTSVEDNAKSGGLFSRLSNTFLRKPEELKEEPITKKPENSPTGEVKPENSPNPDEVKKNEPATEPEPENMNTAIAEEGSTKPSSFMGYITSFFNTSNVSPDEKESRQLNSVTPSYTEDNESDKFISHEDSSISSEIVNNYEPSDNNNEAETIYEQSIESNSGFDYGNSMPF